MITCTYTNAQPSISLTKTAGTINDLYDGARMVGDRSVGIAFIATGLGYNKDIFKKNGWAPPTSWKKSPACTASTTFHRRRCRASTQ